MPAFTTPTKNYFPMKSIKYSGLVVFLIGLGIFTILPLIGTYQLDQSTFDTMVKDKGFSSELFVEGINNNVVGQEFDGMMGLSAEVKKSLNQANDQHRENKEYDKVIYTSSKDMAALLGKASGTGFYCSK